MESKWRQNVADLGWADADILTYARYLVAGVPSAFAAVKLKSSGLYWNVVPGFSSDWSVLFFTDGPYTWETLPNRNELEPDST